MLRLLAPALVIVGCSAPLVEPTRTAFTGTYSAMNLQGWWCVQNDYQQMGACRRSEEACLESLKKGRSDGQGATSCGYQTRAACLTAFVTLRGKVVPFCYESMRGCETAADTLADFRNSSDYRDVSRCIAWPE